MPDRSIALAMQEATRLLLGSLKRNVLAYATKGDLYVAYEMAMVAILNFNHRYSSILDVRKCGLYGRGHSHRAWVSVSSTGIVLQTKTCKCRHSCPRYAMVKMLEVRGNIDRAVAIGLAQGSILLCTVTVEHRLGEPLTEVLNRLKTLRARLFHPRSAFVADLKTLGLVGTYQALETTYGNEGWHPHFHVLIFVEQRDEAEIRQVIANYATHLTRTFGDAGAVANVATGSELIQLDGESPSMGIAMYLTKENPLACVAGYCGAAKEGSGVCPWCLRIQASEPPDAPSGVLELVHEYETAMRGEQSDRWGNGSRAHFGITAGRASTVHLAAEAEWAPGSPGATTGFFVEDLATLTSDAHIEFAMLDEIRNGGIEAGLNFCQVMQIPTSRAA